MTCVLAVVALLAAILMPAIPRTTSRTRLSGYAVEIASVLKGDRNAAMRTRSTVMTQLDTDSRTVRSGAGSAGVEVPADVAFSALVARQCAGRARGSTIDFFPSGASCGGVVAISRDGFGYQIRVNWLTGAVEVVATGKT
jgi:general secretion pathway protein H